MGGCARQVSQSAFHVFADWTQRRALKGSKAVALNPNGRVWRHSGAARMELAGQVTPNDCSRGHKSSGQKSQEPGASGTTAIKEGIGAGCCQARERPPGPNFRGPPVPATNFPRSHLRHPRPCHFSPTVTPLSVTPIQGLLPYDWHGPITNGLKM